MSFTLKHFDIMVYFFFRDIGLRLTRCQYSTQHHSIWAKMIKVICWIFHTLWLARSFGQKLRRDHTVCIWSLSLTLSILWRMLLSISHSYLWTHWTHCGIPMTCGSFQRDISLTIGQLLHRGDIRSDLQSLLNWPRNEIGSWGLVLTGARQLLMAVRSQWYWEGNKLMSTLLPTKTAGNDDDLSQDDSYVNDVDCRGN